MNTGIVCANFCTKTEQKLATCEGLLGISFVAIETDRGNL